MNVQFSYKAADAVGKVEFGCEEADSSEQLLALLKSRGKYPLEVKSESQLVTKIKRQHFSIKERLLFTRQLSGLLNAGLSLERSLAILSRLSFSRELGEVISQLHRLLQEGHAFTTALGKYPDYFPPLYINLVRAGESGGMLPRILTRLVGYEEEQLGLRNFIISSLVYPIILVGATLLVLLFYVGVVIPKFQTIFAEMDSGLPLITQIVMAVGLGFKNFWWLIPLGLAVLFVTFSRMTASVEGGLRCDRLKLRLPLLGEIFQKIAIARMSMSLSMLCGSGVPLLSGLGMAAEVSGNRAIGAALQRVVEEVKQGSTLIGSMSGQKIFPVLALEMIGAGEESGNLGEMLGQVAKSYETDVKQSLALFFALVEPLIILVMVGVIAVLAIAILLPIVNINSQMGR
jgi:general secretion pathway protein F